jgi:hypothetical protein
LWERGKYPGGANLIDKGRNLLGELGMGIRNWGILGFEEVIN